MKLSFTKFETYVKTYFCELTEQEWEDIKTWARTEDSVDCMACYSVIGNISFIELSDIMHGVKNPPSWMDTLGNEIFLDDFIKDLINDSYELGYHELTKTEERMLLED